MTILDDVPNPPELRPARADADKLVLCAAIADAHRLGRAGTRAHARFRVRLAVAAAVGVVVLLVAGALTLPSSGHSRQPGSPAATGPVAAPKWRLVGDVTSSWRTLSALGYEPGLFLACPSTTTCYADNLQQGAPGTYSEIEVTHDGGESWQPSNLPVSVVRRHSARLRGRRHVRHAGDRRVGQCNLSRDDRRRRDLGRRSRTEPAHFVHRRHSSRLHNVRVLHRYRFGPRQPVGNGSGVCDQRRRDHLDRLEPAIGLRAGRPPVRLG